MKVLEVLGSELEKKDGEIQYMRYEIDTLKRKLAEIEQKDK